ncbi:MAG: hypothetical protein H7Z37_03645 [Pyrinomonadaceae bacterium]|nr:hypothetical protein [Pyrinomonadaceae bacterium]
MSLAFTACQNSQSAAKPQIVSNTPTEAYKNLFASVKSKDTDSIKQNMSKATIEFVESAATIQKVTPEKVFQNGLTATTMTETLPQMRDERIKDNYAALEVQSPKGDWEDLMFVKENGSWKLAVGDLMNNTYKLPAPPASQAGKQNQSFPNVDPSSSSGKSLPDNDAVKNAGKSNSNLALPAQKEVPVIK